MNFIDRENLRLKLQWLNRWHSGFTGIPMWPQVTQAWFDRDLERKRLKARDYLILRRKDGKIVQLKGWKCRSRA